MYAFTVILRIFFQPQAFCKNRVEKALNSEKNILNMFLKYARV